VFIHLLLDQMWLDPRTLLWPIYGLTFERADLTNWAQNILSALFSDPAVYVPEIVGGGLILVVFSVRLIRNKEVRRFFRYGEGL
jgi:inner membrane protein